MKHNMTYRFLFVILLFCKLTASGVEYVLILRHGDNVSFNAVAKEKYNFLIEYIKKEFLNSQTHTPFEDDILHWETANAFEKNTVYMAEKYLLEETSKKCAQFVIAFRYEKKSEEILIEMFKIGAQDRKTHKYRLDRGFDPRTLNKGDWTSTDFNTLIADINDEVSYYLKNNRPRQQIYIKIDNETEHKGLPDVAQLKSKICYTEKLLDIYFVHKYIPNIPVLHCRFLEENNNQIKTELTLETQANGKLTLIGTEAEDNVNKKDVYIEVSKILPKLVSAIDKKKNVLLLH